MKYTYYGHSCFSVESAGKTFLFDPFIQSNPLAEGIDVETLRVDYILLSHGHFDHVADLIELAKQTNAKVFAMYELAQWAEKQGIQKVIPFNFGVQNMEFGKLRVVHALHSSTTLDGTYAGNPAGFVLELEGKQLYYAGDTGLTMEMKLLADLYTLDYAVLPIGGHFTMDVEDALMASTFINCNKIIGVHYNTFPEISIDNEEAKKRFESAQKMLFLPDIGESIAL